MPEREHSYTVTVQWTGNRGSGTSGYRAYGREHTISAGAKPVIPGSSDPAFLGEAARWNPEDLLVASVSACHELWYLHLCAEAGVTVLSYADHATGTMVEDGAGRFTGIVLRPRAVLRAGSDVEPARRLHDAAHERCFIAPRSLNFPVSCEPTFELAGD